jgi:hypothetical protein
MASTAPDQMVMMQEILEALKNLQINQVQLASSVDAISGRVNVLAGLKEVRDVAGNDNDAILEASKGKVEESIEPIVLDQSKVPESPSLTAEHLGAEPSASQVGHKRSGSSTTSRIILTYVFLKL